MVCPLLAKKDVFMAEVVPFKGIRYNPELISDMAAVVAPPYDVIDPREQDAFYERHPQNVIRLILGKTRPGDDARDNVHTRSARTFEQWMADGVLATDAAPAFYLTAVDYTLQGRGYKRYDMIGRVRLEPFERGIILPHERTFSKVKSERLLLRKACHANFSPIFGLYTDGGELLGMLRDVAEGQAPVTDLLDGEGHRHRLWRVVDSRTVNHLGRLFHPKRIYIADGHHRYETALNYRRWVQENHAGFNPDHPANYVMMSLSSMQDPGLTILPAHRLIKHVPDPVSAALLKDAPDYFDIFPIDMAGGHDDGLAEFNATLSAHVDKHAIGLYAKYRSAAQVMVLKEGVMARLFADELPAPLRDLDVTVLTHLVMMKLMGFDQGFMDDATRIAYRTTTREAVRAVNDGEAELAFILNPTRIEQVQKVSEHGLIMPRKSTYFYPKVICGLVFNRLR
jgi:uncharacterized protein (DUF1015 family)